MVCPLCDHPEAKELYRETASGRIVRCENCRFVYSDPPAEFDPNADLPAVVDTFEVYLLNAEHRLKALEDATGMRRGKLLDVGCYTGTFAAAAKRHGFEVWGVELVAKAAAAAERDHEFQVYVGPLEDVKIDAGPFDLITFIHSLEHMDDPRAILKRVSELLTDQGVLMIEAPNFDSSARRLIGKKWRQFIQDHKRHFSIETLKRLLDEEGFDVLSAGSVPKIMSAGLFADRVTRYVHRRSGLLMTRALDTIGLSRRKFRLDLGDIMLLVARKRR
jgi:2-polyprenyl-3-methyl-5-hydroxy-6-metoxy-1,4-benzoquinol methylase